MSLKIMSAYVEANTLVKVLKIQKRTVSSYTSVGQSYRGKTIEEIKKGSRINLGFDNLRSNIIEDINSTDDNRLIVTTLDSVYLIEEL